jgi:hypothetical protein
VLLFREAWPDAGAGGAVTSMLNATVHGGLMRGINGTNASTNWMLSSST